MNLAVLIANSQGIAFKLRQVFWYSIALTSALLRWKPLNPQHPSVLLYLEEIGSQSQHGWRENCLGAEAVVLHNRDVDEPSFVQPSPPQHSVAWVEEG